MKIGIAGPILTDSLKRYLNLPAIYPKGLGGISVNNLIIGLLQLGCKVSVYTLDINVTRQVELNGEKLKIYFGEYRRNGRSRMLDCFRKEYKQIEKFIRIDMPDIVNAHWGYEFAIGAIKSGYPHLITLRDVPLEILKLTKDLYSLERLIINYWVMRNGMHFSANSAYTAEKLKRFKKQLPVISNSILIKYISENPKELSQSKVRIVSILNGWGEIKNPQPALKAFSTIRKEFGTKVEYHLFGPGYEQNGFGHSWTRDNDLLDGVFFHGQLPYEQLMNQLRNYDLLLHPSLEKSFGMTLIEAMAQGLPVIAGKYSGAVPWVLNYGKNGILVDVASTKEIADALRMLTHDEDLYRQLSSDGIQYVWNNFSEDIIAREHLELYRRVLNGQKD